jgi:hypothetical protein
MKGRKASRAIYHWYLDMLSPTSLASVRSTFASFFSLPSFRAHHACYADNEGNWGMRIESALAVRRVNVGFLCVTDLNLDAY